MQLDCSCACRAMSAEALDAILVMKTHLQRYFCTLAGLKRGQQRARAARPHVVRSCHAAKCYRAGHRGWAQAQVLGCPPGKQLQGCWPQALLLALISTPPRLQNKQMLSIPAAVDTASAPAVTFLEKGVYDMVNQFQATAACSAGSALL